MPNINIGKVKTSLKHDSCVRSSRKVLNIDDKISTSEKDGAIEMQPMLCRNSDFHHTTTISKTNSEKNVLNKAETNSSTPSGTTSMQEPVITDKVQGAPVKGISPSTKSQSNHSIHSVQQLDASAEKASIPTLESESKIPKTWSLDDENNILRSHRNNKAEKSIVLWI